MKLTRYEKKLLVASLFWSSCYARLADDQKKLKAIYSIAVKNGIKLKNVKD